MSTYPRAIGRFGLAALEARGAPPPRAVAPTRPRTVVRLWLPLTPLFLLLAPFALLLALLWLPFNGFVPPPWRVNPFAAVLAVGRLLLSLGGTDVDADTPQALVRIKLF